MGPDVRPDRAGWRLHPLLVVATSLALLGGACHRQVTVDSRLLPDHLPALVLVDTPLAEAVARVDALVDPEGREAITRDRQPVSARLDGLAWTQAIEALAEAADAAICRHAGDRVWELSTALQGSGYRLRLTPERLLLTHPLARFRVQYRIAAEVLAADAPEGATGSSCEILLLAEEWATVTFPALEGLPELRLSCSDQEHEGSTQIAYELWVDAVLVHRQVGLVLPVCTLDLRDASGTSGTPERERIEALRLRGTDTAAP